MTTVFAFIAYAAIVAFWTYRQWCLYRLHMRRREQREGRLHRFWWRLSRERNRLAMSDQWLAEQRLMSRVEYHGPTTRRADVVRSRGAILTGHWPGTVNQFHQGER